VSPAAAAAAGDLSWVRDADGDVCCLLQCLHAAVALRCLRTCDTFWRPSSTPRRYSTYRRISDVFKTTWRESCKRVHWRLVLSSVRQGPSVRPIQSQLRSVCNSPSQNYGASPAVWDHTVLPCTRHGWMRLALTLTKQDGARFTYPSGMEGWVEGWLYMRRCNQRCNVLSVK